MKKYLAILPLFLPSLSFPTTFSAEQKKTLVDTVEREISRQYILQENIPATREGLQKASESEAMKQARTPKRVAEVLSKVLEKHDKHFGVRWYDQNTSQSQPKHENWFTKLARKNSGFNRVEVLEGNVGYIDFWGFDQVNDASRKRVEAAMALIENTDAIIFDLRNNGGGDGNMGRLINSYLFDEPTHLNSIYWKATDSITEFWTFETIKGKRMVDIPVYILTSKDTFSAAESFAYQLKHLKRATIIGETTKGGANPWQFFQLDDAFGVVIPIAKAINPITKSNWEGTGVEPDITTRKEDAFNTAYQLSLQQIQKTAVNPEQIKEVKEKLELLETNQAS
ncbi:S41 family peptidase [Microbulbifer variabilis]|uniref:S41 family peptidase n=1 Tax=Microbulbifer variabilis TaxID=266805 RepID=UPI001CFE9D0D|nr:S41 family peptidase [Microbulbifer variabilis]